MRLIVKPDLWGRVIRLRFSNTFGTRRDHVRRRVRRLARRGGERRERHEPAADVRGGQVEAADARAGRVGVE